MSDNEIQSDTTTEVAPADEEQPTPAAADPGEAEQPEAEPEGESFPRDYVEQLRKESADRRKERDILAAQVEKLQRRAVEKALKTTGVKPAAVWSVAALPDLIAEDGTIDDDKLSLAIDKAVNELGAQRISKGNYVAGVGGVPNALPKVDRWSEAFTPRKR